MHARKAFHSYVGFIAEQGRGALEAYSHDSALWTHHATVALVKTGRLQCANPAVTAKGHREDNAWRRSEYLNLDVTILDRDTWRAPLFIAEHENSPYRERIQYNAWKLLAVDAEVRVLVCYWKKKGKNYCADFAAIQQAVGEVCAAHPKKCVLVIAGQYDARPASIDDFVAAHQFGSVGGR